MYTEQYHRISKGVHVVSTSEGYSSLSSNPLANILACLFERAGSYHQSLVNKKFN